MRLYKVQDEFGRERVALVMRAYPLIPREMPPRPISPHSVRGRAQAGQEGAKDGLTFVPWPPDKPYPRSSMPALEAAKCALAQGEEAFRTYDLALFHAFFTRAWDISDREVLLALVEETGLERASFLKVWESGEPRRQVLADAQECAHRYGSWAQGIPLQTFNDGPPLVGCAPLAVYRRAVLRHLDPASFIGMAPPPRL
ncbi:MAG: DsbA family protein [Dehalococcoidia bacterium]|nr:DsbA family protein [Dehalococcoidia bacterium]